MTTRRRPRPPWPRMSKLAFTMNWHIWDLGGRIGADKRTGAA